MKKMLYVFVAVVAMVTMWSCSGANSNPTSVAEAAIKCVKNKDYESYVDLIYIKERKGTSVEKQKQELHALLAEKGDKTIDKKQGIQSWEILGEEIAEDGNTAKVKVKIIYGDGTSDNQTIKTCKTEDGSWMLDLGK